MIFILSFGVFLVVLFCTLDAPGRPVRKFPFLNITKRYLMDSNESNSVRKLTGLKVFFLCSYYHGKYKYVQRCEKFYGFELSEKVKNTRPNHRDAPSTEQ